MQNLPTPCRLRRRRTCVAMPSQTLLKLVHQLLTPLEIGHLLPSVLIGGVILPLDEVFRLATFATLGFDRIDLVCLG